MAMLLSNNQSTSSSNHYYRKNSSESTRHSNTQASAYSVDAATGDWGGAFEGGKSPPTPPRSPTSSPSRPSLKARKRSGDAAYHIKELCEREFCETLKTVFLVEKDTGFENSLVMDVRYSSQKEGSAGVQIPQSTNMKHDLPTPSPSPDGRIYPRSSGMVKEYVEVWDYAGDAHFRGFVAEKENELALFIFFDKEVIGKDLKPGLMALLELASSDEFACDQLVICLDRTADAEDAQDVARDLKWTGAELVTLDVWAGRKNIISDRWMFMAMDT